MVADIARGKEMNEKPLSEMTDEELLKRFKDLIWLSAWSGDARTPASRDAAAQAWARANDKLDIWQRAI